MRPADPSPAVHELVAELDYPMFIVTVGTEAERAGCLVGFATQCSIDPPRFLVCISEKNHTFAVARRSEIIVVHLVPDESRELAELFGSQTGDEVDKFARCQWSPGPGGAPILDECANWFAATVIDRVAAGDHWAFLLDPFEAASDRREAPFTFHRARRLEPGHEA